MIEKLHRHHLESESLEYEPDQPPGGRQRTRLPNHQVHTRTTSMRIKSFTHIHLLCQRLLTTTTIGSDWDWRHHPKEELPVRLPGPQSHSDIDRGNLM